YHGSTSDCSANSPLAGCGNSTDTYDVWYSFTPENDGIYQFYISNNSGFTYPVVSIYDDCGGTELYCWTGLGGIRNFDVLAYENYKVRISQRNGLKGEFSFMLREYSIPVNDDCINAIEFDIAQDMEGETYGATGTDISSCGYNDSRDIWYKLTATGDQNILLTLMDYDGMAPCTLSLFDACGGSQIACSESSESMEGMLASVIYEMSYDETIYVRVAYTDDSMGHFEIQSQEFFPPDNDECIDAEEAFDYITGTTLGASGTDVNTCGIDDDRDVWYTYTPGATGEYAIYLHEEGEPFIGTLTIYDGDICSPLPVTELLCFESTGEGGGEEFVTLTAGQTYLIRVASDVLSMKSFDYEIFFTEGE
ncbi:MAG: hypothetical protein GY799_30875, partial [Desulfobulbaceae bacterium]|nr:hypothetical protein [Desulfobulbaceae bacterium]